MLAGAGWNTAGTSAHTGGWHHWTCKTSVKCVTKEPPDVTPQCHMTCGAVRCDYMEQHDPKTTKSPPKITILSIQTPGTNPAPAGDVDLEERVAGEGEDAHRGADQEGGQLQHPDRGRPVAQLPLPQGHDGPQYRAQGLLRKVGTTS